MSEQAARRPGLPQGWVWTTLGESTHIVLGQSPPSSTYNHDGIGLPFYQGKAEFGATYPTPEKWCTTPRKIAEKGDVLISVRAPVGPTNICADRSCIGRGLAAIRGLGGVSPLFLMHLLRSIEDHIAEKGTGTTFKAITGGRLKGIGVPLPPLAEQQRIVAKIEELFSQLDAGVAALQKAKALLRPYRQAVLNAAMSGELTREWREAHKDELEPASVLLERILEERRARWEAEQLEKMKAKGKVPEGAGWKRDYIDPAKPNHSSLARLPPMWAWATIDSVAELVSGQHILKKDYDTKPGGLPYLTGPADFGEKHPAVSKWTSKPKAMAKKGDVLITVKGAGVGKSNMLDLHQAAISRQLMSVRAKELDANFVFWFVKSAFALLHELGTGSTVPGIDRDSILGVCVPIAPVPEQAQVASEVERCLSAAEAAQRTIDETLTRSARLRQSILKKAFEGRLVPQDPADEPASVLLQRIKADKISRKAAGEARNEVRSQDTSRQMELF